MSIITKLFSLAHSAPVNGKIVGAKEKQLVNDGMGGTYEKYVDPALLEPGQSYVQFRVINPMANADALGLIFSAHALHGWAKVIAVNPQRPDMCSGSHNVTIELDDGTTTNIDILNVKKCIPTPL